ncbi:MAG: ADP-ribosylglycohydrolase family protein [Actinomycetes bacterium]
MKPPPPPARLSPEQTDRAAGVLLALACGDALGAGYEFEPARIDGEHVGMVGGGAFRWQPGEWTDDTSMAVVIAQLAASGEDLNSPQVLDELTGGFVDWADEAKDIGISTRHVLSAAHRERTQAAAAASARRYFQSTDKTGNGSLMRTAPVALAFLHDSAARDQAARAVSAITHGDPEAGEACALWCHAIAHAVLFGDFDGLRLAVNELPDDRALIWNERLDKAESVAPHEIEHNGWVVAALMAAWSAIVRTQVRPDDARVGTFAADHLSRALEAAVRAGSDTDTVAAIAGGLLGARWGASAVPLAWQRIVHGWPGLRGRDLIRLAMLTANGGHPDSSGWPSATVQNYTSYGDVGSLTVHPRDDGVLLSGIGALRALPAGVDAVVSLCRLGQGEVPAVGVSPTDHVEVWLIDRSRPDRNPHLDFVLTQAADTVAALRSEGRTVLLHCVQAHSRTPTVAALFAARHHGVPVGEALQEVELALPGANPNRGFREALGRLDPAKA